MFFRFLNFIPAGLACAFLLLQPTVSLAQAENQDANTARLDAVRVVSSPIIKGNTVSRYGFESTVVTEAQIHDLNAQDIASALRRTPGVTISRYNPVGSFGGGAGGGIFIRGAGSSRPGGELAMLYDGVPRMNPIWSHPLLDMISIDPAGSIDVYKAAQPQTFGNAHVAVDVKPKRMQEEGFKTKTGAQYGTYNTFAQTAEHGGKKGPADYYVGQSFRSSEGHRVHSNGQLENYYGRLGFQVQENWNISWFGNFSDNYTFDPGEKDSAKNDGRYATWDSLNTLTFANDYKNAFGHVKFYYNQGDARWDGENGGRNDTKMEWEVFGARSRETITPWKGGELIVGLDIDSMNGKQTNRTSQFSEHTFNIYSPYLALSHQFGEKDSWYLIPSAGFRQYWHNEFDEEPSPQAGLILGYKDTEMHFGYSRSVVYPGLNVVIMSEVISPPLKKNNPKGWKELSAETMDHFELGVSHIFNSVFQADITGFYDEGHDRYRMYSKPGTMMPAGFENIDEYKKYGMETTFTVTPTDDLNLFAAASFLKTEPFYMPYAPRWTLTGGANWRFMENFQITADATYRESMYTNGWSRAVSNPNAQRSKVKDSFLVNAKLSYFFDAPSMHIEEGELFIAGENLTDTQYEYLPGYPMPGATVMCGLNLTF